jgi:thiol-disulfide isomerase/thioredoxin
MSSSDLSGASRGLLVLLIALFLALYLRAALRADHVVAGASFQDVKDSAPALELQDLQGHPRTLNEFRGRVVLVHFWASWCGPCKAELPALNAFGQRYEARGLTVLAVNVGESPRAITRFLANKSVPGLVLQDGRSDTFNAWGARGIPTTFLLDRAGTVRGVGAGALDWTAPRTVRAIEILLEATTPANSALSIRRSPDRRHPSQLVGVEGPAPGWRRVLMNCASRGPSNVSASSSSIGVTSHSRMVDLL